MEALHHKCIHPSILRFTDEFFGNYGVNGALILCLNSFVMYFVMC